MNCLKCTKIITSESLYCNFCGSKQTQVISYTNYNTPRGWWRVTTEGDCEGKSIKDLGIYEGYIDDIAKNLSQSAFYALHFEALEPQIVSKRTASSRDSVEISIPTSVYNKEEKKSFFQNLFRGRPVKIEPGTYNSCVKLVFKGKQNE